VVAVLSFNVPGYRLCRGSGLDRAILVKFLQQTYQELQPQHDFAHLAFTVEHYFSSESPLWWVEANSTPELAAITTLSGLRANLQPIGCLWLGDSVDQLSGDRHAHIFLLYVLPEHRRQGIGAALMHHAEIWAKQRGDRQIGLHVFQGNQTALHLYQKLGYQTRSLWMVKPLEETQD
jgi:ribosomal protein S18 acetylase RimI-like enzyme